MSWLSLGFPVAFWGAAGALSGTEPGASLLLAGLGVVFVLFYGGQRTRVTKDEIAIRYGLAGLRVFRCDVRSITSVRVVSFAAVREFGGYGIRLTRSTVAYFLSGSRGARMGRTGRRDVLIGSGQPEGLAEVVRAVSAMGDVTVDEEEART